MSVQLRPFFDVIALQHLVHDRAQCGSVNALKSDFASSKEYFLPCVQTCKVYNIVTRATR